MQRTEKLSWTGIGFMAIAAFFLAMFIIAAPAQAVCGVDVSDPTGDLDCDGFTNGEETGGMTLVDGSVVPNCGDANGSEPFGCLDPAKPDLFVILIRAGSSLIPTDNPLEIASKPASLGGLGVTTHEITSAQAGADPSKPRSVTVNQNAVRVTESTLPATENDTMLGFANFGTPNGLDRSTVYTVRIHDHVTSVYADNGQTPPDGLIDNYIKHTIAHEIGHMISLAPEYNSRFGGNHYKAGSNSVMEQSVKYTVKGNDITFYVSTDFADLDRVSAILNDSY